MSEAEVELVRYVFLDVVGFTHQRSVEAQSDIVAALNEIVLAAEKNRDPPETSSEKGELDPWPERRFLTIFVPAAVPLLFHSSRPWAAVLALKNALFPYLVIPLGLLSPLSLSVPGFMSLTSLVVNRQHPRRSQPG